MKKSKITKKDKILNELRDLRDAFGALVRIIERIELRALDSGAANERVKIVAWLRNGGANDIVETHKVYLLDLADVIEAGEHLK